MGWWSGLKIHPSNAFEDSLMIRFFVKPLWLRALIRQTFSLTFDLLETVLLYSGDTKVIRVKQFIYFPPLGDIFCILHFYIFISFCAPRKGIFYLFFRLATPKRGIYLFLGWISQRIFFIFFIFYSFFLRRPNGPVWGLA